jgi:hypothetical protein
VRHYTATDIDDLVPLIRKNLSLNAEAIATNNISAEPLDWLTLHSTPAASRERIFPVSQAGAPDLVVVVDCIYHPFLLPALVSTLVHLCSRGASALVVVELRAEDVVREFLQHWLTSGPWELWSLSTGYEPNDEQRPMGVEYAVWVGRMR